MVQWRTQSDNRCNLPVEMESSSISTPGSPLMSQRFTPSPQLNPVNCLDRNPNVFWPSSSHLVAELHLPPWGIVGRKSGLSALLRLNVH